MLQSATLNDLPQDAIRYSARRLRVGNIRFRFFRDSAQIYYYQPNLGSGFPDFSFKNKQRGNNGVENIQEAYRYYNNKERKGGLATFSRVPEPLPGETKEIHYITS